MTVNNGIGYVDCEGINITSTSQALSFVPQLIGIIQTGKPVIMQNVKVNSVSYSQVFPHIIATASGYELYLGVNYGTTTATVNYKLLILSAPKTISYTSYTIKSAT